MKRQPPNGSPRLWRGMQQAGMLCLFFAVPLAARADFEFFEKKIRPVLVQYCYECHSASTAELKGGLRLDSRAGIRSGGDSGPAVVPGDPAKSLLLAAIRYESIEMPPNQMLPAKTIADFQHWIETGAADPRDEPPTARQAVAARRHLEEQSRPPLWSLQPLPTKDPLLSQRSHASIRPIDHYVGHRLEQQSLTIAHRAAAHRQVRRLSLVLIGLPPDPATVQEFVDDPSDEQYARLVDHYLESPHFGERWARHWMDVVRFAETWGYEWNFLIRDAWRYRDYLIRAFNLDLPYDQLIREHIAGDLLTKPRLNPELGINESIIGTAFFRFGETGHDDCKKYPAISLDVMDNQIDTLSKAFQALTVSCARCHDHKLDAIPQEDYYALLGIMASSRQVMNTLDLPRHQADLRQKMRRHKHQIRQEIGQRWLQESRSITGEKLDALVMPATPALDDDAAVESEPATTLKRDELARLEHPLSIWNTMSRLVGDETWQQRWDQLAAQYRQEHQRRTRFNRDHFTPFADFATGEHPGWSFTGTGSEQGFAGPGEFSVLFQGDRVLDQLLPAGFYSHLISQKLNATLRSPLLPADKKYVSYRLIGDNQAACRTIHDNCQLPFFYMDWFDQPEFSWTRTDSASQAPYHGYLEWVTRFDNQAYPNLNMAGSEYRSALKQPRSYFGITKVVLHDEQAAPLPELDASLALLESSCDSSQTLADRYRTLLQQAIRRWIKNESTDRDVVWLNLFTHNNILSRRHDASERLSALVEQYRVWEASLQLPRVLVGMADQGDGFDVPLLAGGEPTRPGRVARRRYLSCLQEMLPSSAHRTGSGRTVVAEAIAHPDNPLTARVMVNRIWHHLFGAGLVKSVDNFGSLADRPSHPELLDYLARRFIDSGWSTKSLIREIVLSHTFRQASTINRSAVAVDPENRLLHYYPARRLEAEVIRDSILAVSGQLDRTLFGPSIDPYRDAEIDNRRLYVGPLDGSGRRSVYLKVTRMGPSKILALFNLPAPGMTTGRRDTTNVPAQALGLLNHPFVHQQAERHAQQLLAQPHQPDEAHLQDLYRSLLGRPASSREIFRCQTLLRKLRQLQPAASKPAEASPATGQWKELIHTLYNLKEFTYIL